MAHLDEDARDLPTQLTSEKKIKEQAPDAIRYLGRKQAHDLIPILGLDRINKEH